MEDIYVERLLQTREPVRLMSFLMNEEEDMTSSDDEVEEFEVDGDEDMATDASSAAGEGSGGGNSGSYHHEGVRSLDRLQQEVERRGLNQQGDNRWASPGLYHSGGGGPLPSGADAYSFFLWSRLSRPWPFLQMPNFVWFSRDMSSRTGQRSGRRSQSWVMPSQLSMRDLLYNFTHPRYKSTPRLVYFTMENNSGRGFIKEQCFSTDGRILISPFANGVRLLSFDSQCSELCDCEPVVPEQPRGLHVQKQIMIHNKVVLTTRFSPTQHLLVTGGMDGSVAFLTPEF
jgi:hypothetical protein